MAKFANILGFLGLGSDKEAVTEAHLEAADTKIAQLEQAKADAESKLATAEGALKTAQDEKAKADTSLKTEQDKVATLERWKAGQKASDGRTEDESNSLDAQDEEPKAAWEVASANAIASAKKRVGQK
jgi:chromosome segregation ATPase